MKKIVIVVGALGATYLSFKLYQSLKADKSAADTMDKVINSDKRGIRNNNPCNIEYNKANNWLGQTGTDGRFSKFSDSKYGIRAAAKLVSNYMSKYGLYNVKGIIGRWAPSEESANHTQGYIDYICKQMNITPTQTLEKNNIPALIKHMIYFENGENPYTNDHIINSCALADIYGTI